MSVDVRVDVSVDVNGDGDVNEVFARDVLLSVHDHVHEVAAFTPEH